MDRGLCEIVAEASLCAKIGGQFAAVELGVVAALLLEEEIAKKMSVLMQDRGEVIASFIGNNGFSEGEVGTT